jgi:hypothetical protein
VPRTEDVTARALRRIWEDLPSDQRLAEPDLARPVREAQALEALWIPSLADWTGAPGIWDNFRLWASIHINNYNDFASEFLDVPNPAIQRRGTDFETSDWDVRTGTIDADGDVQPRWEFSRELTHDHARDGAHRDRDDRASDRGGVGASRCLPAAAAGDLRPRDAAPASAPAPLANAFPWQRPPGLLGLLCARHRTVGVQEVTGFHFWNDAPYLQVYDQEFAPPGYVVVAGRGLQHRRGHSQRSSLAGRSRTRRADSETAHGAL